MTTIRSQDVGRKKPGVFSFGAGRVLLRLTLSAI
jgi:hypothetical protein